MDHIPLDKDTFDKEAEKNPKLLEIVKLMKKGISSRAIATHFGVTPVNLREWCRKATLPPRKFGGAKAPKGAAEKLIIAEAKRAIKNREDDMGELVEDFSEQAIKDMKVVASNQEDHVMAELAAAQDTPADKYQHYIAAAGIKLLRDSMMQLRGPRTVRELSELDQLIRRNLGLNARTGGGTSANGNMKIDISILNGGLADKGKGSVGAMKKDIIDVPPAPPKKRARKAARKAAKKAAKKAARRKKKE